MDGRATFSIYLFHLPIAQFLTAVTPWSPASWPHRAVVVVGTLVAVYALAEFAERRKAWWRQVFSALIGRPEAATLPLGS
jgi:peptidoglycan/LPS O-acetylase OafA/YrhL